MHPLKFKSHTDAYYLKRSNLLLDQIRLSPLGKGLYLQAQQDMAITINANQQLKSLFDSVS